MKRYKEIFFYLIILVVFTGIIYFIINRGNLVFETPGETEYSDTELSPWSTSLQNVHHPLAILLLQIITIILTARVFAFLCKKIKQPTVIGEVAAGIMLGPTMLAHWWPAASEFLFPAHSLDNLEFLSQIGLILFMFVIGMELDIKVLRKQARDALIISHAGIVVPFTLGVLLSYYLYDEFAPEKVGFASFALFTGIAMSITAFPVLARIVQEKGLAKTRLGTIAITCAAADDISAWCLLAVVIAIVKAGSAASALVVIVLTTAYVIFMIGLVRPFLKRIGDKYANRETLSKQIVAVFFVSLLCSACLTEIIGVHALFGAFMAGVVMPSNVRFRNVFTEKVEDIALVLLLPLFFVFTGLRTEIGLLSNTHLWVTCGLIITVAVGGKFFGSSMAARFIGHSWKDSLTLGTLMNTRGLMELIVLNIGYDLGVLSSEMFAMMVIMAVVTTLMTSPALYFIHRFFPEKKERPQVTAMSYNSKYNVLVAFGSAEKGVALLRIANVLVQKSQAESTVTAMHLTPSNEINQYNFIEFEKESFGPIKSESRKLRLPVNLYFKPSQDIEGEISETANQGSFNLLLVGSGRSVFEGTFLGKLLDYTSRLTNPSKIVHALRGKEALFEKSQFDEKVNYLLRSVKVPLGILIARRFENLMSVLYLVESEHDAALLPVIERLLANSDLEVHMTGTAINILTEENITALKGNPRFKKTEAVPAANIETSAYSLVVLSLQSWRQLSQAKQHMISRTTSVLLFRQ